MLISALCDYYDILAANGKIIPDGFSSVGIRYLICLSSEGNIDDIIDCQDAVADASGKEKRVPHPVILPKRTEKPGIDANCIEHRAIYIFGLNYDGEKFSVEDRTEKARKSHEAFSGVNESFISEIDTPIANAYRNFIESWEPAQEIENQKLLGLGKNYTNASFGFCLSGRPDILLHEDKEIKDRWSELYKSRKEPGDDCVVGQCGVTGETEPIARIHDKISGVPGGLSMGNTLICIKGSAMESYNREQAYNSNISQTAMEKYTQALNILMHDRYHRTSIDDFTIIHWAMSPDDKYDKAYSLFFGDTAGSQETDAMIGSVIEGCRRGSLQSSRLDFIGGIDPGVTFYIVGIKPNSSRIAIKFIYRRNFGDIIRNAAQHQADMMTSEKIKPLSLWQLCKELVSPKAKENPDPALLSKLYEAVLYGVDYPYGLLASAVRRVRTDSDTDKDNFIKLNPARAGIIKACLNRKCRLKNQEEEIKLALDKENSNPAYLCGRLFAVLEKLQVEASGGKLNRTIKDAYFSSASSTPAAVFPKLLRLAQYYLSNSKVKYPVYYNKLIGEITDKLDGMFPGTLILADQGRFIIGYYQQNQDFYKKSETVTGDTPDNDEEE